MPKRKKCTDHLSNEFLSLIDMCNCYEIHPSAYLYRRKLGWSLEKALTTPNLKRDFEESTLNEASVIIKKIGWNFEWRGN